MAGPSGPASLIVRSRTLSLGLVVAVLATACGTGSGEVGTGFLTVADLATPARPGHFARASARVTARLAVSSTGCVTVTVDGVTRMPFWPAGTRVEDGYESRTGNYGIALPGGPTLQASGATGDTFTAEGVIDDGGPAFDADGKVGGFLGFCGVKAAPIAFRDASTVTRSG